MDLIAEVQKADRTLRDPYATKMATAPIDCSDLMWRLPGWCCRRTENRRTHLSQPCPLANRTGTCLREQTPKTTGKVR